MEFIKELVEHGESLRMRQYKPKFSTYEDRGFRMLQSVKISDEVSLSIQASYGHYCSPRKTLPIEEYTEMELAIFKNDEFVSVEEVTKNDQIIEKFSEHYEGTVYGYVPLELIEELYKDLQTNK